MGTQKLKKGLINKKKTQKFSRICKKLYRLFGKENSNERISKKDQLKKIESTHKKSLKREDPSIAIPQNKENKNKNTLFEIKKDLKNSRPCKNASRRAI